MIRRVRLSRSGSLRLRLWGLEAEKVKLVAKRRKDRGMRSRRRETWESWLSVYGFGIADEVHMV